MKLNYLLEVFKEGTKGRKEHLETLKKELKRNGFKLCGMGVSLMIGELEYRGMEQDCATYWKTLGMISLPYNPADALK